MKPSPAPRQNQRAHGPQYWRSLEELANTPEFEDWLGREFPRGASEWRDPVSRRHFVQIMSASFLLAGFGLSGCRKPEEIIHPFSKMPENYTHGVPQFYATSMPDRRGAQALLVKSADGRPIKIEGNPRHPLGLSGTNPFVQASILDLYDVDRSQRFVRQGNAETREKALDFLAQQAREMAVDGGAGVCFLMEQSNSPSRQRLQTLLSQSYPKARWFTHESIDFSVATTAATLARQSGEAAADLEYQPYYRLDRAKVIVALDHDFLGGEADSARHIRDFARSRKVEKPEDLPSRLYAVEALMTLTGANADHRLRLSSGMIIVVAAQLVLEVLAKTKTPGTDELVAVLGKFLPGIQPAWVHECALDLLAHRGAGVVLAGHRQPLGVHALVNVLNQVLENEGVTVETHRVPALLSGNLGELARLLASGQVKTLVLCGGNPVYHAATEYRWSEIQRQAATVIRWGYHEDETSALSGWHFPAAHYLESWGDARTSDGTLVSIQPLIAPLFDGLTELEFLARLGGLATFNPYEIVRATFKEIHPTGDFEIEWSRFLRDGFLANSAYPPIRKALNWSKIKDLIEAHWTALGSPGKSAPSRENLEIIFSRDYRIDDGRYINNGWLQELPDPVTKVTWENVISLSIKTAKELGVFFENPEKGTLRVPIARVECNGRAIEGPVWLQPGQADYTIGLTLGYGRRQTGRVGHQSGFDAGRLRPPGNRHSSVGARLVSTGKTHPVATTQAHWLMEGRPIVREANLEQFRRQPDFVRHMDLDAHEPKDAALYQHPLKKEPARQGLHQWGMAIDLQSCVGCSACMMACQSENNIPIVGKSQVGRGREMHWIRLDRYYTVAPADQELSQPQVVNQPMLCQHCENAPCESVCPVNATVHDEEGLNVMVYNRCVGTRYCSNNCPYKVRRFNFFDYNQRPLDKLYLGPLAPKGMPDLVQMVKNPDVTVRMRGVMEKCTFCVQRIEQAKIAQKIKAGASDNVRVPDGTIIPACAQACPAEAIVFGDVSDPGSRVSRLKQQSRNYSVLGFLNTDPRTTYLARIRNPNPAMPDYYQQPLSLAEYARLNGDPLKEDHSPEAAQGAAPEPAKGGH